MAYIRKAVIPNLQPSEGIRTVTGGMAVVGGMGAVAVVGGACDKIFETKSKNNMEIDWLTLIMGLMVHITRCLS